jgi:starch-binding outer membrane protein, SusD/RagB family
MTHTRTAGVAGGPSRAALVRGAVTLGALALAAMAACKDSNVPFFTAPTTVPNTPQGINNGVTGLISGSRLDYGAFVLPMAGFGRQAGNYTNTEPRFITYNLGVVPSVAATNATGGVWAFEYTNILQAKQILATLPNVVPAYSSAQLAGIAGLLQTMEAYNYMIVAEAHDTLGIEIQGPTTAAAPALVCVKDGWSAIVALLDTANANLNTAGAIPIPVVFPLGFGAVSATAAPSTAAGSFAAFNRALAAKAGLELAYAIARSKPASTPTPTSPGTPDAGALTRADSAANASALFAPTALTAPPEGGFSSTDKSGVYFDFSSTSGDQVNPINAIFNTLWIMKEVAADQDTVHDLRWLAKFSQDTIDIIQQPVYSPSALPYHYSAYSSTNSPMPIIRDESLTLIEAQIQLGLGNLANAMTLINDVRTLVGGESATSAATYVDVRDALLKEQQISTILEGSSDRAIALRMYKIEAIEDTTWNVIKLKGVTDQHTTVLPIPVAVTSAHNGVFPFTCSQ